jgi:predicted DNA repair protein MutK
MATGLLALLDDVAALAKVAAASIDDVAGQAAKAGAKAAGVVIDDAAVTPRYVVGFAADRELPIVGAIAVGSLRNKLLILLPVALALGALAPWAITPLLMIGGAYLAYEGTEKVYEAIFPHAAHEHEAHLRPVAATPLGLEAEKVAGAIKTDFILSAEIMAITLASLPAGSLWSRAVVMAVVAVGITVAVYGGVALIVKADDAGVALARNGSSNALGAISRGLGRGLVIGMPVFLKVLAMLGTAAMIWVGGGILVHGLDHYGLSTIAHFIHDAAEAAAHTLPSGGAFLEWTVAAAGAGVVGLAIGAALIPLVGQVFAPVWRRLRH